VKKGETKLGLAKQMTNDWLQHRKVLEELLEQIDDTHIAFKPWDGAMTLGELALHIVVSNDSFVSMVRTEKFDIAEAPKCETMEDVRKVVRDFTQKTLAKYEDFTDEELERENSASHPKLKGAKKNYLQAVYDHEIHHKGQLFTYARMAGIKADLPFFR
jgi:uncharacterized damage-inducible protein DinB